MQTTQARNSRAAYFQQPLTETQKTEKQINRLFVFIFLFSTLSGAIRKWFIASDGLSNAILGIQLVVPFGFLIFQTRKAVHTAFTSLLLIYTIVLFILAFNPMNETVFHGIFGIFIHLGFWFTCFFYLNNKNLFEPSKFLYLFLLVGIAELLLGFVQYTLPSTHFLNKYANEDAIADVATFGSVVRITGSFSYLGGFGSFMIFYAFMIWAMLRLHYSSFLVIFLYTLGLIGCFMSVSRTPTYMYITMGLLMVYCEFGIRNFGKLLAVLAIVVGGIVGIFYFLGNQLSFVQTTINSSYENFEKRRSSNQENGEEDRRIMGTLTDVIFFPGEYPTLGVGLGSTYQGATAVWGRSKYILEYPSWLEEEPERVVVEGGYLLLFLKIFLFIALYRKLRIPGIAKAVLFILVFLFVPIVFNTYNSTYLFLGLTLLDSTYKDKKAVPDLTTRTT